MAKAIVMKTGDLSFLVETDEEVEIPESFQVGVPVPVEGVPPGMEPTLNLKEVGRKFSEVQDLIIACCSGLLEAIDRIPPPEKVAVEFGIKLAGEGGLPMLTKASGEANFKVSLEWQKPAPSSPASGK